MRRTGRKRGRPRIDPDDASGMVCLTLPGKQYDELDALARRHGLSLPEVIRRRLRAVQRARERGDGQADE